MKLAIAIGSRANYASIKAVTKLIEQDTDIESYIFCFASAVLEKYGSVYKQIQLDGLTVNRCIETSLNSERLSSMAQSTGLATMKIADYLEEIQPDAVITVGDRFETDSNSDCGCLPKHPRCSYYGWRSDWYHR